MDRGRLRPQRVGRTRRSLGAATPPATSSARRLRRSRQRGVPGPPGVPVSRSAGRRSRGWGRGGSGEGLPRFVRMRAVPSTTPACPAHPQLAAVEADAAPRRCARAATPGAGSRTRSRSCHNPTRRPFRGCAPARLRSSRRPLGKPLRPETSLTSRGGPCSVRHGVRARGRWGRPTTAINPRAVALRQGGQEGL